MITFFTWLWFIVMAIISFVIFIVPFGLMADKNNKSKNYCSFFFIAAIWNIFTFIIYKDLFQPQTSINIWKITSCLIAISSFLVLIFFKKEKVSNFIFTLLTISISAIPFFINADFSRPNTFTLEMITNNYPENLYLISLSFLIILLVLVAIYFIARNVRNSKQKLLNEIRLFFDNNNQNSSFGLPYNRLMLEKVSEEISSLRVLLSNQSNLIMNIKKATESNSLHPSDLLKNIINKDFIGIVQKQIIENENNEIISKNNTEKNLIKQLNHFLQTPFSTIPSMISLIKQELSNKKKVEERLCDIENQMQLCNAIMSVYRNISEITFSLSDSKLNLGDMINAGCEMYKTAENKFDIIINNKLPNKIDGINNQILLTVLLPMVQNAITATPTKKQLDILFKDNIITIKNGSKLFPEDVDFTKEGYSTKPNHFGTGLMIIKSLCTDIADFNISVDKQEQKVVQTLKIKRNE